MAQFTDLQCCSGISKDVAPCPDVLRYVLLWVPVLRV